jgi:hypothetical protein
MTRETFQRRYREDMISRAGAVVYIGGFRVDNTKIMHAPGVAQEFEIATRLNRFPVPVGATGGAASDIWRTIKGDYAKYVGTLPRKLFDLLNDVAATPDQLVQAVKSVLEWLAAHQTTPSSKRTSKSKAHD